MSDSGDSISSSVSVSSSSRQKRTTSKHGTSSLASSRSASSLSRKQAAQSRSSASSISAGRYAAYSYEMSTPSPSSLSPLVGRQPDTRIRVSSPGLSSEEFKSRLYHTFRERGLVDSLKSQLRTKLVTELQQTALTSGPRPSQNRESHLEGASLLHCASNSLVADHLKRCGYDYSLAVFLPESESVKGKLFTLQDLLELLKIHPDSKLGQKLMAKLSSQQSKGLLWQILCEVARSYQGGSEEKGVQVDENPPHLASLESKLKSVDVMYNSKAEKENLGQYGIMQDKLTSLQRQIESRFKMEMNMEISRFKESELKRVELEEREKCRKEVARARKEMDQTYRAKSEALQERERSAMERLQKEREHVERETYSQRQSLLEELQVLRQRETELKREADVNARAAKLEEERCKTMEENVKVRETAVANIQETYDRRFKEQTRQFELEVQAKYSDRLRELEEKESKFRGERRSLQEESEKLKGLKDDVKDRQKRLKELETLLQQVRHDAMAAEKRNEVLNEKVRDMIDYQTVKETNAVLRRELENAKLRLSEFTNEQKMERARHEELLKQMIEQLSRPSPEMVSLQGDLDRARHQVQHEKTIMEHRETQMKNKLQAEKEQNVELRRQLEEQSKQMGDMNKQLSDLRAVLRETQTALQNEIYRRPAPSALRSPTHEQVPVHDQMDPEDQYIDTTLRQTHVDPQLVLTSAQRTLASPNRARNTIQHIGQQRLLAADDTRDNCQPTGGLDVIGTQTQAHMGQQRLLAADDTQDNFQPIAGLVTISTQHQARVGQQRLLTADDTQDNFQPIAGLNAISRQHQTHMGQQCLLAAADNTREDLQPSTGYETRQTSRLLADDESLGRSFAPMRRVEATIMSDDGEVSADNSLAFLEETRQRFRQLEKEAENLEQTYQNFQYRVTNPQAIHESPPKSRLPAYQTQGGREHIHFATPHLARQSDPGHEGNTTSSPPEPLVEYPLRDSVEAATMSQHRNHQLQNRGILNTTRLMDATRNTTQATPLENIPLSEGMDSTNIDRNMTSVPGRGIISTTRLMNTTRNTTQATPLENIPLSEGMDSTNIDRNRKSVPGRGVLSSARLMDVTRNTTQATPLENIPLSEGMDTTRQSVPGTSTVMSGTGEDVPFQSRGAVSSRTLTLPGNGVHAQSQNANAPNVDQQGFVPRNMPPGREQMSHLTQGTSFTHADRSVNFRYDTLPRMEDLSNLTDQSQLTNKSQHKSSLSSLSEHSLHSEHPSYSHSPPPYSPHEPTNTDNRQEPQPVVQSEMTRANDSLSEEDAFGDENEPQADEKGSSGFIPKHQEQEAERLRRLQEEEREEREWEERRKRKEEERKRKEEEARERERQMLMELQRQEEASDSDDKSGKEEEEKEKKKDEMEEETGEAVKKDADEGLNIDPVMQKYMQMVQQRKQQETGSKCKQEDNKGDDDNDDEDVEQKASILSGLSQGSISGVEGEDKQKSQGATTDEDDPFDDW